VQKISRRTVLVGAPLVALGLATGSAAAQSVLVDASPGTLPLLLTVPHDGTEAVPGVPRRTAGVLARDTATWRVARATADALVELLGGRPYLVAARFARRHIDANRPPEVAYESPLAAPVYDAYHERVAAYVAEVRARFPHGALLLDVHGQAAHPNVLLRGTQDGLTVPALLGRAGDAALSGPFSIFGQLAARGYPVAPAPNAPLGQPPETLGYRGGYTVVRYGSQRPSGIDAIQIEIGADWRQAATIPGLAYDLAAALAVFTTEYLRAPAAAAAL
jgi:N-formylglutamate amidohydrolase